MEIRADTLEEMKKRKIIRLSKSCLGDEEKKAVLKVLDNEFLGMGVDVQRFEKLLSAFFEREAVCVSTGTSALQISLEALGIGSGDEVLVQSLTYVATFQAITATGATPIACDIDAENFCVDLNDASKRVTKRTKAIIPVHYAGGVGDIEKIYSFANRHNLRVIEDAAHAFGTKFKGKRIGSFGDVVCFSFDGIKNITSGEGGCIVTGDPVVLGRVKDARLLGVEKDTEKRFNGQRSWLFDVNFQGWRYHMSNIMAAIGCEQLLKFEEAANKRQKIAKFYVENLSKCSQVRLMPLDYNSVVPHIFVIENLSELPRTKIISLMEEKGVQIGFHYQPNHLLTYFRKKDSPHLQATEELCNRLITLPLHPDLTEDDVDYICFSLLEIIS